MSFKRSSFDNDNDNGGGSDGDAPFHKRQRFDDGRGRGRGGRGRGGRGDGFRGRGDGFRGGRGGGGFRGGRGGFNRFNDDNEGGSDRRGRGGFRGDRGGGFRGRGGGRGRGGNRFDGERGRGRGRGDFRGGRGGFRGDRQFNDNASIIKVQQDAPDFQNISNEKSENISLKQYRGKYVVLFIYFKDNTYGCSSEQKAFRDLKPQFDKLNATILGVSRDDVETHKSAATEANLNFSLLADTEGKISKSYGALDDNDRVTRCTFIIAPDGKVAAVWGKVFGFTEHAQQVLDKLKEIVSGGKETKGDNNDDDNDNDVNQNDDNEANQNDDDDDDDDDDNDNDNNENNDDDDNDDDEDDE